MDYMFVGRTDEQNKLETAYNSKNSQLVVVYGRRRIGKSCLIAKFAEQKKDVYCFEALEHESTSEQIKHFTSQLKTQLDDPLLASQSFTEWAQVFNFITERLLKRTANTKLVLFFDELQWMAVGRGQLISLLKYYWDNQWKQYNVMLILCGSIASFMINKVLHSKALYGRVNVEMRVKGLSPQDSLLFFKGKRSQEEILKYLLIFGGVPKYLEEINLAQSFDQNIKSLCFTANAIMLSEVERIFYSQFKEARTYLRIVSLLKNGLYTLNEISQSLKIASGGGLREYLTNLELAEIIHSYIPYDKKTTTKFRKYTLADEFLKFYFKIVEPSLETINDGNYNRIFEQTTKDSLNIFLGFAFENFCIKNSASLASKMGFADQVIKATPYFGRTEHHFQIDLLYLRADKVITICEVKYHNQEIGTSIIPEMDRKCSLIAAPRGYAVEKALISLYGPDKSLEQSKYFDHVLTLPAIFS